VLGVALSLAVITAGIQVSIQAFRLLVLREFIWTSPHFVWMTPLAYVPYFAALGVLVWLVDLAIRRLGRSRHVGGKGWWQLAAMVWFGLLSVSMLFPRVALLARVVFTLGLSLQVALWMLSRWTVACRRLHVTAVLSLATMLATGVLANVLPRWRERRWLATQDRRDGAPNVLIVILDTVRAMSTSITGHSRSTTPNLEGLAREGLVFERAYSPAPWSLPSHASLLTGYLPHELSASHLVPLDSEYPTLAEVFRRNGYATGAFVANMHYASRHSGILRGFGHVDDAEVGVDQILWHAQARQSHLAAELKATLRLKSPLLALIAVSRFRWTTPGRFLRYERRWAPDVNRAFLRWADALDGRPFFALLNYFDAHAPYEPPDGYQLLYDSSGVVRRLDAYEGAITYVDQHLGALFADLRVRGLLDRTIVVVTSDHGEEFGEHGLWEHGRSLNPEVTRVPMVLRFPPDVDAGSRVSTPVSLCEVGPTLLDLAELAREPFGRCRSLVPAIRDEAREPGSPILLEMRPEGPGPGTAGPYNYGLVDDSLHYVKWIGGREDLFRRQPDGPGDTVITDTPAGVRGIEHMRATLRAILPPSAPREAPSPAGVREGSAPR
jgi:arylsulfatase A-like enzyme